MKSSYAVRNARLKAAQARWAQEDRERGYPVQHSRRYVRVRHDSQQLKNDLLVVGALAILALLAGVGAT